MNALLIACLACTAAAAAGFAFLLAAETLRNRHRTCYHNLLRQRYLRIVMLALFAERPAVPHFPCCGVGIRACFWPRRSPGWER